MYHVFAEDDAGYIAWVKAHSDGFVVVSWNPPRPEYTSLHRADCHHINPEKARHVENWTHSYIKACGDTIEDLNAWAERTFGASNQGLYHCKHCERAGRL